MDCPPSIVSLQSVTLYSAPSCGLSCPAQCIALHPADSPAHCIPFHPADSPAHRISLHRGQSGTLYSAPMCGQSGNIVFRSTVRTDRHTLFRWIDFFVRVSFVAETKGNRVVFPWSGKEDISSNIVDVKVKVLRNSFLKNLSKCVLNYVCRIIML